MLAYARPTANPCQDLSVGQPVSLSLLARARDPHAMMFFFCYVSACSAHVYRSRLCVRILQSLNGSLDLLITRKYFN